MSDHIAKTHAYDENVPVLIVGGSLVGLSTALFLSWHGISYLLVERHAGISPFPRAGGYNPRTVELFRTVGIEQAVREAEPAFMQNMSIMRMETLAGKELSTFVQNLTDFTSPLSPARMSVITQDRLEPVLRAQAEKLGGNLRFKTELVSFEQSAEGVSAVIRDLTTGQKRTIFARYMVAADGNASPIRQRLGIATHGHGTLAHQVNMIFRADLRAALHGRRILVGYLTQTQGVFGGDDDGGLLSIPYHPERGEREEDFAGARGVEAIRTSVGIPDLPVEIVDVKSWEMAALVAERFQQGNIFLAGDSAHVNPPTGGFGANTGIQDAYNLAWKLALVLKEMAGSELLASYDAERRPVAEFTVEQAFLNYVERMAPHLAGQSTAHKVDPDAIFFGYLYHSAAIVSGSNDNDLYEDPSHPSGRSGSRAPHVMLERNGERISTLDLFSRNFILLAAANGRAWYEAAQAAAHRLGIALDAHLIGGDLTDVEGHWSDAYGVSASGAVLVRPDGFIGWRAEAGVEDPENALVQALSHLLCRKVPAQA
jgi:putative polyketide hydroxylase